MLKKAIIFLLIVSFAPISYGMSLEILVNGDPDPDIRLSENETAVLSIVSPDGYSAGDDVYFMLHVETSYGTAFGGVVTPAAPDGSSIGPCSPGDYCIMVIGPGSNGVWGVIMSITGTPAPAGVYFDEIVYRAGGAVVEAVISLYTTPDFVSFTIEDSVVIRQGPLPECMKTSAPEYSVWEAWGKPACWCYARQCRCDIDGVITGPFWVAIGDLNLFRAAFNKTDLVLQSVTNGICADLDHSKTGPFRVGIPDLNICRKYLNKVETLVPECDPTNYNFWETP